MSTVKPRHPLEMITKRLGISRVEIARRYGCSEQFVFAVFSGKSPAPARFEKLVRDMLSERAAETAKILLDAKHPVHATSGKGNDR